MKFFTPDLIERFGSPDERIALAAQEELEQRAAEYVRTLRQIEKSLPPRFRELLERYYLHDARVLNDGGLLWSPDMARKAPLQASGLISQASTSGSKPASRPAFGMTLQLDTPPREILVLHYRSVIIEAADLHPALREEGCPHLEWQYDEVEVIPTAPKIQFRHSILLTQGIELRLRFEDFDFATMKPIAEPQELAEAR
jgi:hypothetical protein